MQSALNERKPGSVAIATPEQVAELEQNLRLALDAIETTFNVESRLELQDAGVLPCIRAALLVVETGLRTQLDAEHSYTFSHRWNGGPHFAWERDKSAAAEGAA